MTVHVENHRSYDRKSLRSLEIRLEPESQRKPRIYERASQLRTHMFEGFAVPSPFGFGARYKRVSNTSQHVSFNSTKNAFSQTVSESKPRKPAAQTGNSIPEAKLKNNQGGAMVATGNFIVILIILLLLLVGSLVALTFMTIRYKKVLEKGPKITKEVVNKVRYKTIIDETCENKDCIRTANHIVSNIDATIDPCEDFYEYACGEWFENNRISAGDYKYSVWTKIEQANEKLLHELLIQPGPEPDDDIAMLRKAKQLYEDCRQENELTRIGLDPLILDLMALGGWQPLGNWDRSRWDFQKLLLEVIGLHSSSALFLITTMRDPILTNQYSLVIQPGGLTLPGLNFYLQSHTDSGYSQGSDQGLDQYTIAYRKAVDSVIKLLGGEGGQNTVDQIVFFERELANLTARVPYDTERLSSEKLNDILPVVDWPWFMKELVELGGISYESLGELKVLVSSVTYLKKLSILISETPVETLHNYLIWRIVVSKTPYLTMDFRHIFDKTSYAIMRGNFTPNPRWKTCVNEVVSHFPHTIGYMFTEKTFPKNAKDNVKSIIHMLKDSFIENLKNITWMDSASKNSTIDKLNAINFKIGYPDFYDEYPERLASLVDFDIIPGDYYTNIRRSNEHRVMLNMRRLQSPIAKDDWESSPYTRDAYYAVRANEVIFPAGVLQPPLYSHNSPSAVNFGAVGSLLAHEIFHAFDSYGAGFDADGNSKNLWTDNTTKNFQTDYNCVKASYQDYLLDTEQSFEDQVLSTTLFENLADMGGVHISKMAFDEYKRINEIKNEIGLPGLNETTQDQVFFISFGQAWCSKMPYPTYLELQMRQDPHAQERFRVVSSLKHATDFAKAFKCPAESRMNVPDERKCRIWG